MDGPKRLYAQLISYRGNDGPAKTSMARLLLRFGEILGRAAGKVRIGNPAGFRRAPGTRICAGGTSQEPGE